jgi:hypothetical protein
MNTQDIEVIDVNDPKTPPEDMTKDEFTGFVSSMVEEAYISGYNKAVDIIASVLGAESYKEPKYDIRKYMQDLSISLSKIKLTPKEFELIKKLGESDDSSPQEAAVETPTEETPEDSKE